MEFITLAAFAVGVLTVLGAILSGLFTVEQQEEAVIERFGKFVRTAKAGLNFKIPFIETAYKKDVRVQQLDVDVETKTKDNVFVKTRISVQYQVADIVKATYKLTNSKAQISSYVFDVVRAQVPKLTLDETFEKKTEIAQAVKEELADAMDDYGFTIVTTLLTDIDPDERVKEAMNEINAQTRLRQAANEKAEAEKITEIKKAEAEAASKALQGKGIADQRKAIVDGLRESIAQMSDATGASSDQVMSLILMTQYFDTLKSLGEKGGSTILLPHQPGSMGEIQTQIISAIQAGKTKKTVV